MNSESGSSRTLYDHLATVPDFRRGQGMRYPLPVLLVMMIMSIMSRSYGYREMARFMRGNKDALIEHLKLERDAMPSHVTIRTVMMNLDFDALNTAFRNWVTDCDHFASLDTIAIDAKALRSTVTEYDNAAQDFVCFVSAYAQQNGAVVALRSYQNKGDSEITVSRELIKTLTEVLQLQDVTFTLDALHCQKKQSSS